MCDRKGAGGGAFDAPTQALASLSRYLSDLDTDRITSGQAAELLQLFSEIARVGQAGQILLAPRAAHSDVWKIKGYRSAASWLAKSTGSGLGDAIATLETGQRLEALPLTAEALRKGSLSLPQAKEIAAAAVTRPSVEADLLEAAGTETFKGLKERCQRVRASVGSAVAENERYEGVRKSRFFWHWADADGALRGEFKLTPDDGARLLSAVDRRANELFDEARKADVREAPTAYAADALVDLVTSRRSGNRAQVDRGAVMHIRVDAAALRRGNVEDGEVCEIPGVGPVPVSTARSFLPESFVKILVTEGVEIATVCHIGRTVPSHLRSAIEERDRACVVPGCDVAAGLEIDHWQLDFALGGETTLANLARLCHYHHSMKTYQGFELRGGPGKWEWEAPPDFNTS